MPKMITRRPILKNLIKGTTAALSIYPSWNRAMETKQKPTTVPDGSGKLKNTPLRVCPFPSPHNIPRSIAYRLYISLNL